MEKLIRAYYYLFYKFYKMSEAAPSRWLSDWKAGVVILVLELWFIYSMFNYYSVLIDKYFEPTKIVYIIIAVMLAAFNYFAFVHTDTWKEYVKEFDALPKEIINQQTFLNNKQTENI